MTRGWGPDSAKRRRRSNGADRSRHQTAIPLALPGILVALRLASAQKAFDPAPANHGIDEGMRRHHREGSDTDRDFVCHESHEPPQPDEVAEQPRYVGMVSVRRGQKQPSLGLIR